MEGVTGDRATATRRPARMVSVTPPTASSLLSDVDSKQHAPAVVATRVPEAVRPVVGGLLRPDQVPWYEFGAPDPLAHLLSRHLNRALLDPLHGGSALAEEWTMTGNRATFTLAEDGVWSDGTPLRAADIVTVLRREMGEGNLPGLQDVKAVDERTVEIVLAPPACSSLVQVATWPIVDAYEWMPTRVSGDVTVEEQGEERWVIEPDGFSYQAFPDELELREAWEKGEINTVVGASRLTMGSLPGAWVPSEQAGPLLATLIFALNDSMLEDDTLREALTLATDRSALFADAYGFAPEHLPTALLPPGHWAAPTEALPSSAKEAATLLSQAGWRDRDGDGIRENEAGESLRLVLSIPMSHDHRWERLAKVLAEQWEAVGIQLSPLYLEAYMLHERLHTDRWQVALVAYTLAADPDQRALWSEPTDLVGEDLNVTGYHNAEVADLMIEGEQVPGCEIESRAAFYQEAWAQLLTERPLWPLFVLPLDLVQRSGVEWPGE
ncbi:MAG: ABC transporter substrate-binding protein [Chloroflexota bacterium]|nr:ABC transporter substrate-binding protein [Chloroflexota bacterium]